ncbi:UNVERIFIED_ORG: ABC-type nickel/cobalt efflux system permease component RcnA [Methylobacterium sp. SuP10 SLI 274]|nr:ABC-type nickel/cobalt efflux system permease component RcnA [Methylorubrum extorquens]MDF9863537.1 ABC-type nickel/cobalt efflux system permease component RcnA [Methylorubrum pseudosasae]MDH6637140.1 ABC-type nickel/cobalt efflux system permease component RcnA [Methylobacterium sp. SuP10 SLI 274]MDH6666317.1 ABC-type nickel/cobalt efflux system permease component RcnA [Methylorubrum zatmanii]
MRFVLMLAAGVVFGGVLAGSPVGAVDWHPNTRHHDHHFHAHHPERHRHYRGHGHSHVHDHGHVRGEHKKRSRAQRTHQR